MRQTPEEIRLHYLGEKELALRLRLSNQEQRAQQHGQLFRCVPFHPISDSEDNTVTTGEGDQAAICCECAHMLERGDST